MDDQIESVGSETVNPFSAPQSEGPGANAGQTTAQPTKLGHIAKRVFLDWEKLRLAYIGILVAFTILIGWSQLGDLEFWGIAIFGGVVANLCYFLGPIVETYVTWLGLRSVAIRWIMFVAGTLFTMAGALVAIITVSNFGF